MLYMRTTSISLMMVILNKIHMVYNRTNDICHAYIGQFQVFKNGGKQTCRGMSITLKLCNLFSFRLEIIHTWSHLQICMIRRQHCIW